MKKAQKREKMRNRLRGREREDYKERNWTDRWMNAKESEQISEDESAIAFENLKNVCL